MNGFAQGLESELKYCLRDEIVKYSSRYYGGFMK